MHQNDHSPDTTDLYAWLSRDQDGIEGIIAAPAPNGGIIPLVMASRESADKFRDYALASGRARQMPVSLVRFHRGTTLARYHFGDATE